VKVVSEAGDAAEALRFIAQHQPELVLLELASPKSSALEFIARVTKEFPAVRLIILSFHATDEDVSQVLRCGARGFLLDSTTQDEFEIAVKAVAKGKTYVSPEVSNHLIDSMRRESSWNLLTARQREILRLIVDGQSTKEIALNLNISVKTVETHRRQLMDRLGIHDIAGLVRYALKNGLNQLED